MSYQVKKGKPIRRPRSVYPFEEMDVGDYFDAPDDMGHVGKDFAKSARRHSILSSARNYALRHDRWARFTTALLYEEGRSIVRCWRVEDSIHKGERVDSPFEVKKPCY